MQGRIVSFRYDKHALQLYMGIGWTYEGGIGSDGKAGRRYWKTIEDAEQYAKKNNIDIIQKCWMA